MSLCIVEIYEVLWRLRIEGVYIGMDPGEELQSKRQVNHTHTPNTEKEQFNNLRQRHNWRKSIKMISSFIWTKMIEHQQY